MTQIMIVTRTGGFWTTIARLSASIVPSVGDELMFDDRAYSVQERRWVMDQGEPWCRMLVEPLNQS